MEIATKLLVCAGTLMLIAGAIFGSCTANLRIFSRHEAKAGNHLRIDSPAKAYIDAASAS